MIKKIFPAFILILLAGLVSAYNSWGYSSNPLDFLQSEWIGFGLIFAFFFAVVFFGAYRAFKGSAGPAAVVALVIAFIIAAAMARGGLLYDYAGNTIGSFAFIFAIIVAIGLLVKLMHDTFGKFGGIASILLIFISLYYFDFYEYIPSGTVGDLLFAVIDALKGPLGFVIVLVTCALMWKFGGKPPAIMIPMRR